MSNPRQPKSHPIAGLYPQQDAVKNPTVAGVFDYGKITETADTPAEDWGSL